MRILFTGGGSGGHFYPIIAVAEAVREIARARRLLQPRLYFMGPGAFDAALLADQEISFHRVNTGKIRMYPSPKNVTDVFKTAVGVCRAILEMFFLYPDVVFSKGGYGSFPAVLAARFFRIPIVVHESDTVPGRTNRWAARFADRIAVSFPEAAAHFPKNVRIAHTGLPIRKAVLRIRREGAHEFLGLDRRVPTILVLGGSQGSELINESLLRALPLLVERYQIIHQTGAANFDTVKGNAKVVLEGKAYGERYKPFPYLRDNALPMAAGAADLVISRAGASAIFEIASWGTPSVIIPITESNGNHQRKNARAYGQSGAAMVLEEANVTPSILLSEIDRVLGDEAKRNAMAAAAKTFIKGSAAEVIAEALLEIALSHER